MRSLSICMVSFNCRAVIEECLQSLRSSTVRDYEIIVVDNGSEDGTVEYLRQQADVHLVENSYNAGFTKATNQAINVSSGDYVLWLNTDTILTTETLSALIDFIRMKPRSGVVGPKVLNADRTFQPQCKRGVPTPFAALCYTLGLDRLWPQNARVSQYLLRSVGEDETSVVDAVSGCCLLTRRETVQSVGPLDEEMFGFGEDIDWCVRAKERGWEVWYYPKSVIVHLKGQGGAHSKPFLKIWAMHQCMWLFYRKHLRHSYSAPVTMLVRVGIGTSCAIWTCVTWFSRLTRRAQASIERRRLRRSVALTRTDP